MRIPGRYGWSCVDSGKRRERNHRKIIQLNEDVLSEILSHCDIYDVLRFTQVNRHCRRIALSKQLWISLLRDLESRTLLDLDPEDRLEAYETPELIEMVKRIARGPRTWSPASPSPPTVRREVVLHFDVPYEPGTVIHLVPGGKNVVVWTSRGVFELWAIAPQRCIWRHPAEWWFWSMDVADGGRVAVVGLATEAFSQQAGDLEVREVDLWTGDSRVRFQAWIPYRFETAGPMNILGDFLTLALSTDVSREILIVNWRADTCVRLQFPFTSLICSSLVGGFLIVAYRDSSIDHGVVSGVYPLASFRWDPIDRKHPWSDFLGTTQRPLTTIVLPFSNVNRMTFLEMQTYQSPTRRDAYKVTLKLRIRLPERRLVTRLWNTVRSSEDESCASFLQAYTFCPSPTAASKLEFLSTIPQPRNRMFPHTVSGYATDVANRELAVVDGWVERDGVRTVDKRRKKSKESKEVLRRPQGASSAWPMLGEYSAAVPVLEGHSLRILYFE